MKAEAMHLHPGQRLAYIKKEWHTRKRDGKDICYVVLDRQGSMALLTQKLPALTEFINSYLVSPDEPYAKVNTVSLWQMINQQGGRVGGWHKNRWRVLMVDLESASSTFEAARQTHKQAAVIGIPGCYRVCG